LVLLLFALWRAEEQGVIVAHALLASLAGLALLEHWLMVVPLPDAKLWQWMLPESVQEYEEKGKYHEL
jgi:putative photosynthetic complex assembly protein 2